jgi:hypothetical protein
MRRGRSVIAPGRYFRLHMVKGERIGVDGSTIEANAALRTIVRRDSGETYARC